MVKVTPGAADIIRLGGVALASQFKNPKTQQAVAKTGGVLADAFEKGVGFEGMAELAGVVRRRRPRGR
jgi:hypothetical protein